MKKVKGSPVRVNRAERWLWGGMWYLLMVLLLISIPAMAHRGFWVWD